MNGNINQPNVLINQQRSEGGQKFKLSNFLKPKIIFTVLGIVILVELIFAVRNLQKPLPPPPNPPLPITGASFELLDFGNQYLETNIGNQYKVGEKILVQARLLTGGNPVDAADFILRYDPKVLSLSKNDITAGKIFTDYPLIDVDEEKGTVKLSGTASDESFIGIGIMAELNFSAKGIGKTSISLEYQKGDTKDSNIVDSKGEDILERVQNLEVEIR